MDKNINFKRVFKVLFVDFMAIIIGVMSGFLLPKFLDINEYSQLKVFTLYISYSSMLHLGFCDGLYILLAGKTLNYKIEKKIKSYFIIFVKFLFIVALILILLSIFIFDDVIFKFFIIYSIPFQITLFFSLVYRATGELEKYTKIRVFINIFTLIAIFAAVMFGIYAYMIIQSLGYFILSSKYLIEIFILNKNNYETLGIKDIKYIINIGMIMLLANSMNNIFFSLDKWIIKLNFSISEFAYYSFAISMINLFMGIVTSISVIFYPILARKKDNYEIINKIKRYIIIITMILPSGYFVLEIIVKKYLDKYILSLELLEILLLNIPFMALINILFSNLYKVNNKGKRYLKTTFIVLIISLILNILSLIIFNNIKGIAIATLISFIIWCIFAHYDFEKINLEFNEIIYIGINFFMYIIIRNLYINNIFKMILGISFINFMSFIFYKEDYKNILNSIKNKIINIRRE